MTIEQIMSLTIGDKISLQPAKTTGPTEFTVTSNPIETMTNNDDYRKGKPADNLSGYPDGPQNVIIFGLKCENSENLKGRLKYRTVGAWEYCLIFYPSLGIVKVEKITGLICYLRNDFYKYLRENKPLQMSHLVESISIARVDRVSHCFSTFRAKRHHRNPQYTLTILK